MPNHKSTLHLPGVILTAICLLFAGHYANAFAPDFYAQNSVLANGSWAKIEVQETGMQFVSDATIRNLGFSDPDKVNVYGYGGVVIPDNLKSPDDLPELPSVRVPGGIVFFGKANVGWTRNSNGATTFSHQSHPYSDHAFYFLSDVAPERRQAEKGEELTATGTPVTDYIERMVHEQDLSMAMNTGRLMLGEDFKSNSLRTFKFQLPGNIGNAIVTTAFGCKTSAGTSSLVFTANGKQLEASTTDQMAFSASKLIVTTKTVKEVNNPGSSLDLTIKFNGSGVVSTAALDYIEVEYPRSLTLNNGELYFYIAPASKKEVKIGGATASTIVWDVTVPENPVEMPARLEGNTLSFVSESGTREYVAFDPSKITRPAAAGNKVANQNIHAMEAPGMLVISPQEYISAANRLADLHKRTDGLEVLVLTPEEIYNEFSSGKPDVSAFRKLLKMWYDRAEARVGEYTSLCLIMSRPTYDNKMVTAVVKNAGYPRVPIWQSATGETPTTSYSTDDFIGMLKDVSGNFNIGTAEIHVAVGRMPVKSLSEANTAIDKLETYLLEPDYGAWRNNIMIIADDQDNGVHLDQAESVVEGILSNEYGNRLLFEKLYLDSYEMVSTGIGNTYPQAHERLLNKWNEGVAFIDYIGHANPKSWGHEYLMTWTDINSMANKRLPYIYAATCEFLRWDDNETSGAEIWWLMPSSGVIGMICPSREVLISANGVLNKSTSKYFSELDDNGLPLPTGEIMRRGKNDSNTGTNKLRYGLIGDPSMRLPWAINTVKVNEINGIDISTAESYPELKARGSVSVSGHVEGQNGEKLTDFNGIAEITLFDGEKAITTNGNGAEGIQSVYNDRTTRLFVGRVKVQNGEWSTTFTMPSEIDNNYSPALLSLYAYDETGREANGSTDRLYAFGYDDNAPDDFEGPKFIEFYLDHPGFVSGNQVSPNPTLTAKFYDESGISVSEAGIGHNITLLLDGKTFFDDVAQYYVPDDTDTSAGSVTYTLKDLTQGDHKLSFTVWDNANNSTTATLDFSISALWKPSFQTLTTDVNPATSSVNFIIATDGSTSSMECEIEVFDIWGKRVWRDKAPNLSSAMARTTLGWNLCDFGGSRIPGGVYLYKATIKTDSGATVTKTKKLIVAAQ